MPTTFGRIVSYQIIQSKFASENQKKMQDQKVPTGFYVFIYFIFLFFFFSRPATSFLWFTSPFKTLKYLIWRRYKWIILLLLILIIVALLIGIFIYSMPVSSEIQNLNLRITYWSQPCYLSDISLFRSPTPTIS